MKIWKIFSLLFVVGVVSIVACAMISDDSSAEVTSGTTGDCTWTLDGTKLTISGNGAIADYEYSKPSPWGRSITEVIIENGVTSIGDGVFSGCKSLTSIIIPDSVTSIGNWASDRCISLTNVSIGNGVTSIGEEAFYSCESLTSITIPGGVTSIGNYAFQYCTSITSITIPNSVTSIGDGVFSGCTSLIEIHVNESNSKYCSVDGNLYTKDKKELIQYPGGKDGSFNVPSYVANIGNCAFYGCTSLVSITMPNSVIFIGEWAFFRCTSLISITIPSSVTSIGYSAFRDCTSLASITIPNSVTSMGDFAFSYCTSLTSITIPNSVTSIERYAFRGCTSLTSITIPNSVTYIGESAFGGCESLTSITIPDSVTSIGNNAFGCCTSLTIVSIGNGVTSIEYGAFYNCTSLTSITIPNSVTSIGWGAFDNCTSLTSITIPNSVTTIGEWPFHPFGFYESNGVDIIEPIAENLAGHTFINKSGKMVKQEEAPPSVTKYTVTFRVNGNVIDTVSYENGATTITEPKIPTIKGYDARWPQYTLSGDIIVDAVLTLKEYKVIYKVDENVVFTDVYKYDSKVIIRDTYSDGKYTYTPWTTSDVIVTNNAFTMIDSDIIFESTSSAVKYTFIVKYVDTDGKEIHPQYQGEAKCDAIISPDIPSISGYRSPDERISIKITEDPSKNVVIYTYSLEDVETEGSSGFPMTYVVVGAIVAVIAIAAFAFVIKKH